MWTDFQNYFTNWLIRKLCMYTEVSEVTDLRIAWWKNFENRSTFPKILSNIMGHTFLRHSFVMSGLRIKSCKFYLKKNILLFLTKIMLQTLWLCFCWDSVNAIFFRDIETENVYGVSNYLEWLLKVIGDVSICHITPEFLYTCLNYLLPFSSYLMSKNRLAWP